MQDGTVSRAEAAERVRGGYISTVHLLPPDEVAAAVDRLEREAAAGEPDLATRLDWRLLVATRYAASTGPDSVHRAVGIG